MRLRRPARISTRERRRKQLRETGDKRKTGDGAFQDLATAGILHHDFLGRAVGLAAQSLREPWCNVEILRRCKTQRIHGLPSISILGERGVIVKRQNDICRGWPSVLESALVVEITTKDQGLERCPRLMDWLKLRVFIRWRPGEFRPRDVARKPPPWRAFRSLLPLTLFAARERRRR